MPATRKVCPITREQFLAKAKAMLPASVAGVPLPVGAREFGTGSLGWYGNNKMTLEVDGQPVTVQVGITVTIVGSKDLAHTTSMAAA